MALKPGNISFSLALVLILIFQEIGLTGQNYSITTYTTKDGLAHNNVRTIAADSTGFLWVGTWDGLSRFDGYEFRNYRHIPGDSASLPFFSVTELVVDGSNNLWIFTDWSEVVAYNREKDNFSLCHYPGSRQDGNTLNICCDKKGDLWIIERTKLVRRDCRTGKFTEYPISDKNGEPALLDYTSLWINADYSDTLWLAGYNTAYSMHLTGNNNELQIDEKYSFSSRFYDADQFDHRLRFSIYRSDQGNIWMFSNIGLFRLDRNRKEFMDHRGNIPQNEFNGNQVFSWSWKNGGMYIFNPETRNTLHIPYELSYQPKAFTRISKNEFWFSSTSSEGTPIGLKHIVFTPDFFRNYLLDKAGKPASSVFALTRDHDNSIWAGIMGQNHIAIFKAESNSRINKYLTQEEYSIAGSVRSMVQTDKGIWVGYLFDYLLFYDYRSQRFSRINSGEKSYRTIITDNKDNLLIGNNRFSIYSPVTGNTEILWTPSSPMMIHKMYIDKKGILWAGMTASNLLRYDMNKKEARVIKVGPERCSIEDIVQDGDGNLWLALLGAGVCRYTPETGKTKYYTTLNGLSSNVTYSLFFDKLGYLWISTNEGISMINISTGQIRIFNKSDGLEISEFNSGARYSDGNEILFGGMGGFVSFYPDSIHAATRPYKKQKILLTGLSVSGESILLPEPLDTSDTIILGRGENNFRIYFSSTDFVNSTKTKYRHKLNGISNKWEESDYRNRDINYSNLKPGFYLLTIEATDANGNWTASKTIRVVITPYFYQTKLFIILIPLLVVGLIAVIIVVYIRQIKQRERQKQDALRQQALRGQMNPHFIFNSLNSINYFISKNDRLSANRYISDFARLIRSILANVNSDYIPFHDEVDFLSDYLKIEHLRFGDKFDYKINPGRYPSDSEPEIVPGLVQPFIENAIWHGIRALEKRKGNIRITFSDYESGKLFCTIEDDGIGRMRSAEKNKSRTNHASRGISLVMERLQIISKIKRIPYEINIADLYNDRPETGTVVTVEIPCRDINKRKI